MEARGMDGESRGAHLPRVVQDPVALGLAERYAPRILFDQREPFLPVAVGYTIFTSDACSLSFPRRITLVLSARMAIEYAIWWDWDITHLYELEHIWVYISEEEKVIYAEGSRHGKYQPLVVNGRVPLEAGHPLAYAEPGKHAFHPTAEFPPKLRRHIQQECWDKAGKRGLLITRLFRGEILKTPEADRLATAYLRKRAFKPAFAFTRLFVVRREILFPWPALREWIPERIRWCLAEVASDLSAR